MNVDFQLIDSCKTKIESDNILFNYVYEKNNMNHI